MQTFTNDCFYLLPIRTMNCFIPRYVLAFQHLFHLILLCVMFLSFSFFFSYFLCSLRLAEDKATYPRKKKKNYDICKFQIFKKITIFRNILKIRRLCLDCICHFQRATSQCYIISIRHRKLAGYL